MLFRLAAFLVRLAAFLVFLGHTSLADAQSVGGVMTAHYDLHAAVSFPQGISVGGRMRLVPIASIEASVGFLPFTPTASAGLNLHTAPGMDSDPALSFLGTIFAKNGTQFYCGSLMFGWLGLRKTSLHSFLRGGVTGIFAQHADGSRSIYPAPALEAGLAFGF